MKIFKTSLFLFCLFWLSGCIEQYELEVDEEEKILVVSGMITDAPGPYTVKLSTTSQYGDFFNDTDTDLAGATVTIQDETGFTETLSEQNTAVYATQPNGIRGKAGSSYTLKIRLKDGREYISGTEVLNEALPVDRLYAAMKPVLEVDEEGNEVTRSYVQFLVDATDPGSEKNYYRWNYTITYEVTTQPENFTTIDKKGNTVPAPKQCCRQCWITEPNTKVNVTDDRQFNGNKIVGHQAAVIPFASKFFQNKFHIEVSQLAISEDAYLFWQTLNNQISGTGSVQEPAPANAVSNISNANNPSEKVLGFFSAAGVSKKTLFIEPLSLGQQAGTFEFPDDCRVMPRATTTKPAFW